MCLGFWGTIVSACSFRACVQWYGAAQYPDSMQTAQRRVRHDTGGRCSPAQLVSSHCDKFEWQIFVCLFFSFQFLLQACTFRIPAQSLEPYFHELLLLRTWFLCAGWARSGATRLRCAFPCVLASAVSRLVRWPCSLGLVSVLRQSWQHWSWC